MAQETQIERTEHPHDSRSGQIGERSLGATLSALLATTSDAVACFDDTGTILMANEEAMRLQAASGAPGELVGADVRTLFPPAVSVVPQTPFSLDELPLPADGSATRVLRTDAAGRSVALVARCRRVSSPEPLYLLVMHPEAGGAAAAREHERLVGELSRANRRLSGTLDIVLGTLDSPSVGVLFERVLDELCRTMDATGTTVYLAERDGFHLRGTSASLEEAAVPRFHAFGHPLTTAIAASPGSLRLRVLPPAGDELRQGRLSWRRVMDEETREVYRVPAGTLPPFASFLAVAVRFGGQVIALMEVGWRSARTLPTDDAELLDAVTRYLAVQLVGAFSALRSQRREQLAAHASDVRDDLVARPFSGEARTDLLRSVEGDLECSCAMVDASAAIDGQMVVHLPISHEEVALPADLLRGDDVVRAVSPDSELSAWLAERGEPCLGAVVDCGSDEVRMTFLALREVDEEPFDDLELEYLRQVAETVTAVSSGDQGRRRDHRISQALQTGMRSQLQHVDGISAQGIYSSATEAAFVGGDFYDLIRLPDRRACVIMGDVSGKGVEAASVSAAVRTALGAYSWEGLRPARMVSLLNEFLLGFSRVETFATLFVGIIDLAAGRMTYCSAGHPPAILLRERTGELEWLDVQSGVVGAFHEMRYRDGRVQLECGDVLVLYTDGTTEARAQDRRFFGEEGLRDAVMSEMPRGFDGLCDRLLARVDAFTGNSLDDDVAMVALRFDEV